MDRDGDADEHSNYEPTSNLSMEPNSGILKPLEPPSHEEEADILLAAREPVVTTSASEQAARERKQHDTGIATYHQGTLIKNVRLRNFADFTSALKDFRCPGCRDSFFASELDVEQLFQAWLHEETELLSMVTCKRCHTASCIACTPQPSLEPARLVHQGKQVSWCCTGGRLLLFWILLCGFDQRYCAMRATPIPPKRSNQSNPKKRKSDNQSWWKKGLGITHGHHQSALPSGTGYGGMVDDDYIDEEHDLGDLDHLIGELHKFEGEGHPWDLAHARARAGARAMKNIENKTVAEDAQRTQDMFGALVLVFLKDLLPSSQRDNGSDNTHSEAVTDLLVHSKILGYCAELLRNDSLVDATRRKDIYVALLGFLQAAGGNTMTASILLDKRPVHLDTVNILTFTFTSCPKSPKDMVASLSNCAQNLTTQGKIFLQTVKCNERDFGTEDGQTMLWLCRQIKELSRCTRAHVIDPLPQAIIATVEAVKDLPDEYILRTHAFSSKARALKVSPPGRFKRLVTEITTLKTGLPPGIFVRYCESRLDVLTCAIVGPEGTPYENGLFEFDIFCDAKFPYFPPMARFKGTGGGRISINPNLYADGKVCLSLLGTWSGEPWDPTQSTLLQILVSIQAMILCEEPWYNEPGHDSVVFRNSRCGSSQATTYHHRLRQHTVQYAMLAWLDDVPSVWKDVVKHHFEHNADTILQIASAWAIAKATHEPDQRYDAYDIFGFGEIPLPDQSLEQQEDIFSLLPKLQSALQKYGATFLISDTPAPARTQCPLPPFLPSSALLPTPKFPLAPPSLSSYWFGSPKVNAHDSVSSAYPHFYGTSHVLGSKSASGPLPVKSGSHLDSPRSPYGGRGGSSPPPPPPPLPSGLLGGSNAGGMGTPAGLLGDSDGRRGCECGRGCGENRKTEV